MLSVDFSLHSNKISFSTGLVQIFLFSFVGALIIMKKRSQEINKNPGKRKSVVNNFSPLVRGGTLLDLKIMHAYYEFASDPRIQMSTQISDMSTGVSVHPHQ